MKTFTTKAGTVLPFREMDNGLYLDVVYRLRWFREENPIGHMNTKWLSDPSIRPEQQVYECLLNFENSNGKHLCYGHGSCLNGEKYPAHETAETKAIGRALAHAGYGTLDALIEAGLDPSLARGEQDGDQLADAPVDGAAPESAAGPVNTEPDWWLHTFQVSDFQAHFKRDPNQGEMNKMFQHRNHLGTMKFFEVLKKAVLRKSLPKTLDGSSEKAREARKALFEKVLGENMGPVNKLDLDDFEKVCEYVEGL